MAKRSRRPVKIVDLGRRKQLGDEASGRGCFALNDGARGAVHRWCIGVGVADLSRTGQVVAGVTGPSVAHVQGRVAVTARCVGHGAGVAAPLAAGGGRAFWDLRITGSTVAQKERCRCDARGV
jgi:hypothetical protein